MHIFRSNRPVTAVSIGVLTLTMAACTSYDADPEVLAQNMSAAQSLEATSDSYEDTLVRQYRSLAVFEHEQMRDDRDANRWAEKAVTAGRAGDVRPEDPQQWGVDDSDVTNEYGRLSSAKTAEGIKYAPVSLAVAQTRFDCWVEQVDEGFQPDHIADCREAYMRAMDRVEQQVAMGQRMESEQQAAVTPQPAQEEVVLPFELRFPFDVAQLQPEHERTLDQIADAIRNKNPEAVLIDGHADRAGPQDYNVELSERRAKAVREALAQRGVENIQVRINTDWHGENSPVVETDDGVPNEINRRVEVSVRGADAGG